MPARVLAGRAGFAAEARGVGRVADRQLGRFQDLVAMQVGDGDLGRRDQVQLVARDDVHLVFLVRDLARARGARRVDDGRRPDLGEAVLAGVHVEEPRDQPALERRTRALVDREAGARDLRAARVVDDVERLAELPVGLAGPRRAAGRCVRSDLALDRLVVGEQLPPRPDRDVRILTTDRHVRVGGVRDAQQLVVEIRLDLGQARVEGGDALARSDGRCLEIRDLRAVGLRAALDGLADALRGGVSLGLERLALAKESAPFAVELEGAIDQDGVLALVDGSLADDFGLVA